MSSDVLPTHAKGARPHFFEDQAVDKLLAMLFALVGEVSVLRDRHDTLERLLDSEGGAIRDKIDQYRPSADIIKERDQWRANYLRQIMRVLDIEVPEVASNDTSTAWQQVIDSVVR